MTPTRARSLLLALGLSACVGGGIGDLDKGVEDDDGGTDNEESDTDTDSDTGVCSEFCGRVNA
jgi:hypothetical protein